MVGKIIWFTFFGIIGYWLFDDISNIPLSHLTLKMISGNIFSLICFYIGVTPFFDD